MAGRPKKHEPYFGGLKTVTVRKGRFDASFAPDWGEKSVKTLAVLRGELASALKPFKKKDGSFELSYESLHSVLQASAKVLPFETRHRKVREGLRNLFESPALKTSFDEANALIKEASDASLSVLLGERSAFNREAHEARKRDVLDALSKNFIRVAKRKGVSDVPQDVVNEYIQEFSDRHLKSNSVPWAPWERPYKVHPLDSGLDGKVSHGLCRHQANALMEILPDFFPSVQIDALSIDVENRELPQPMGSKKLIFDLRDVGEEVSHAVVRIGDFVIDPAHYGEQEELDRKFHGGASVCRDWAVMDWADFEKKLNV